MPEQTYLIFRPTRLAYLKWYLIAFAIIITGIIVSLSALEIIKIGLTIPKDYGLYTLVIPLIGIVFLLIIGMIRRMDTYYVTNFRIIERRGLFNIKEDSINWEKVSNYSLNQSFIDRIFNIGTVRLYSMGGIEEEAEVTIKKAPNIHKIKALLDKLIERKGPVV